MADFMTNYGIIACYILLAVAVLTAVVFPIIQLIQNPKGAKGALVGIGALVVVLGISYALSSGDAAPHLDITPEGAKQVDTGLFAFYILAGIAIISLVYSEVAKMFK